MSTAYLGLGGNLGNRREYLANAILALNSAEGVRVLDTASSGGFGASDAAVTLAVDEASALRLASASARGTLTVIIRPPVQ